MRDLGELHAQSGVSCNTESVGIMPMMTIDPFWSPGNAIIRNRRRLEIVFSPAEGIRFGVLLGIPVESPPAFFSRERSEILRNPSDSGIFRSVRVSHAGVTQLVESQPSKLLVAGSSPVSRSENEMKDTLEGRLRKRSASSFARYLSYCTAS